MAAGTWLGGAHVADPAYAESGYVLSADDIGTMHTTASGSAVYDYVGTRYRFKLEWKGITKAQKDAIRTKAEVKTAQVFDPPDEDVTTYTVIVVPNSWEESYIEDGDGTARYMCELELLETTV
jgi:hypothetical protein